MFVRCKKRFKDGKEHRYWSVVENVRVSGGRVVQRQVLYLGEINDSQRAAWCRSIEVVEGASRSKQVALFPSDREAPELDCEVVQVRLAELTLHAPRQWGACWLALTLWERLELDRFWGPRLPASREGTRWLDILKIQVCYRLIDPGSDWRLHRHWYEHSALRDLLGCDRVIASTTLYRCLDKLTAHKQDFFSFLRARWATMFNARFDILLYDLTTTWIQKSTLNRSGFVARRTGAAGGRRLYRNGMADGDRVLSHPHLANEQAYDTLTLGERHCLRPFAHTPKESFHRRGQGKPRATVELRSLQRVQFRQDGTLSGL